jgi:predicted TIM-barrel fold metal-dependent hydrolase
MMSGSERLGLVDPGDLSMRRPRFDVRRWNASTGRPETGSNPTRRSFLKQSIAVAVGLGAAAGPAVTGRVADPPRRSKVIDCHAHLHHHSRSTWEADDRKLIAAADRLGIDELCCSLLTPRRPATAEQFRECNRWVADAMRRFPDRILGYCYVNPGYTREALEEIGRCVRERGFVGVKLYNEYRCTEPVVFPIVELAIELGVPILHHAGHLHYVLPEQPRISDGGHLTELARRYPEAHLICAHICGGGDWEWTIKALRNAPSVFLDTSGSVADDGVVEMAARILGVDRLVFGCDMSMTAGMGRIRGAELNETDKQKILGGTMEKILRARKA